MLIGGDTEEVPPRLGFSNFYDGGQLLPGGHVLRLSRRATGTPTTTTCSAKRRTGNDNPDLYAEVYVAAVMPS